MSGFLRNLKWYGIGGIVAGIFVIVGVMFNIIALNKPAQDFYALYPEDIKAHMHISGDIDFVMDNVTSRVTQNKTFGITTSEHEDSRTYGVPFLMQDDKGYIYIGGIIGVQASNAADYSKIERIADASWEWWNDESAPYPSESFKVDGLTRKMNKQEKKLYIEYLVEACGYSESEANELLVPYVIANYHMSNEYSKIGAGALIFLVGAVATVLGFVFFRNN